MSDSVHKVKWRTEVNIPLLLSLWAFSLSVLFLYKESVIWLFSIWHFNKTYSHGFLVPLISLYFVWEQRKRFSSLPMSPGYVSGVLIILACLALLLASRFSAIIQLEAISLFFVIPGIILLLFGGKIMRAALIPWLYLNFMIPWLEPILKKIQFPFQLVSSVMGAALLNLFFPVYRDGVNIQLPDISMEVAAQCSGVNFLVSILAIGIPLVYFTQRTWTKALLVLVVGCILTILSNGLRVALAGVMGQCYGPELLHGPGHIFQGWFVAWFGWIGLFLFNWAIAKYSKETSPRLHERWKLYVPANVAADKRQPCVSRRLLGAAILFFLCNGLIWYLAPRPIPLSSELSSLSLQHGEWHGFDEPWLEGDSFFPNSDAKLTRMYRSASGTEKVYLFVAYYEQQSEQKRLVSQYSRPLHKGTAVVVIQDVLLGDRRLAAGCGELTVNGVQYNTVFWYQFPGNVTAANRNKARFAALSNGIFTHNNAGAIILLATPKTMPSNEIQSRAVPPAISQFLKSAGNEIFGLLL